jgi:hypothetical protein
MTTEVFIVRNKGFSKPLDVDVPDADRASRDYGSGRVQFFKNSELVGEVTLAPSQEVVCVPLNF